MSGKVGSIGGIVLGAAIIVAGFWTFGATWAALPAVIGGALTMAGGVVGLVYQPKSLTAESARAQSLQIASSSEGYPVPVIFGEQKVIPNFMNWTAENFRSVEGTVAVGGKGGGGTTQPNGIIDYFLSFEVALCMGPIDEIGQVISVPGDVLTRGANYSAGNGVTASQTGVTVTFSGYIVLGSEYTGGEIVWADGTRETITAVVYDTANAVPKLRVATSATISSQRFQLFGKVEQVVFEDAQDYEDLTLGGINEGGLIRVYRGTSDQERIAPNDPYYETGLNYRNVCWAIFSDFWIGRGTPTPRTYQFILRRFPRCVRDNLTTVTGIKTRGSLDPGHSSYYQANPAAVVYELMTNKLWGRKISSDALDEASFISTSEYFERKNIGISFTLDGQEKLSTILDGLRMQLKLIVVWKNGQWKMRCLLDEQDTSATIQTFTANDIEDLRVVRPLWPATINDLRGEFNSREKLYKSDMVHFQDAANIELTGRVNPTTTTLRIFTDWNTAFKQLARSLNEASYPAAMASFFVNRFKSNIEVGDCIRIIWAEWGANSVTAYFIVNRIEPQGKNDDRLKISATEDFALSPVEGVEETITLPFARAWEKVQDFTQSDITKAKQQTSQNGAIFPITAVEFPQMFAPEFVSYMGVFGVKPSGGTVGAQLNWATENSSTYTQLNGTLDFAIGFTLSTPILNSRYTDRSASFCEFVVTSAVDAAILLGVSTADGASDNLEAVDALEANFLIIGDEFIKVGKIELVSGTTYRARNVVRGVFGSAVRVHATGEQCFFRQTLSKGYNLSAGQVAQGVIKLRAYPVTAQGVNQIGDDFFPYHYGGNNLQILGMRDRPFPSEFLSATRDGDVIFLRTRSRAAASGAGSRPMFGVYNPTTDTVDGVIRDTRTDTGYALTGKVTYNGVQNSGIIIEYYNLPFMIGTAIGSDGVTTYSFFAAGSVGTVYTFECNILGEVNRRAAIESSIINVS